MHVGLKGEVADSGAHFNYPRCFSDGFSELIRGIKNTLELQVCHLFYVLRTITL
jgi:hypothetical protein